jgi:hypothetical protein
LTGLVQVRLDRLVLGQARPVGADGAVYLDQFTHGWVYAERTIMLSIGVI